MMGVVVLKLAKARIWLFRLPSVAAAAAAADAIASSEADEASELQLPPPCGASRRTGDALRRIVSSISCLA